MKRTFSALILSSVLTGLLGSNLAMAESAVSHASHASEHSLAASGHTAVSVGMSAVAVVALPLAAVEVAGESMQTVGDSMIHATYKHQPQSLHITEITITVDPSPKEVLNKSNSAAKQKD